MIFWDGFESGLEGCGHGDVILGDVDAQTEAFGVYVGEMTARLVGILVGDVEVDVVVAVLLHLAVYGAGHYVAWRETQTRVVFVHEFLAAQVA